MINYPRKSILFWLVLFLMTIALMITALVVSEEDMSYAGSLMVPASFVLVISLLGFVVSMVQSRQLQKFMDERDYFVEWTFNQQEWEEYLKSDQKKKSKMAIVVAIVAGGFFLFTGLIASSSFGHPEMILVYMAVALLIVFLLVRRYKQVQQRRKNHPQLILGKKSYYLGGIFHTWGGRKNKMENIELLPKTELLLEIKITYSYPSKHGRTQTFAKFPVPSAKSHEAGTLIEILKRTNGLQ